MRQSDKRSFSSFMRPTTSFAMELWNEMMPRAYPICMVGAQCLIWQDFLLKKPNKIGETCKCGRLWHQHDQPSGIGRSCKINEASQVLCVQRPPLPWNFEMKWCPGLIQSAWLEHTIWFDNIFFLKNHQKLWDLQMWWHMAPKWLTFGYRKVM